MIFVAPVRVPGVTLRPAPYGPVSTRSVPYASKPVALTQTTSSVSEPFSLTMTGASCKSEIDRRHTGRRTRDQLRPRSWSTLSWNHLAYPWRCCLACPDPSISLYGSLSWSPCCTCHHWQRSNLKYDPSLYRETSWMSNYIKCSVRPAGRWLFSASGGYEHPSPATTPTLHSRDLS